MSISNNLDWKTYESITKYIYETLEKQSGVTIKGYGNTCIVKGKSGVRHQIDVLTSHTYGTTICETAIECKFRKVKQGIYEMLQIQQKVLKEENAY